MNLLKLLLEKQHKIICFWGHAGIGKTYTVRYLKPYIDARKFFKGGSIYLDLSQINKVDWFYRRLFSIMLKFLKLDNKQHRDLKLNSQSDVFLLSFFVDFFNLKHGKRSESEYKTRKQKHFEEHEDDG